MRRKDRSGRWTVPPTGHKKGGGGGGIQGISGASVARAETLSDALGTRLRQIHGWPGSMLVAFWSGLSRG